MKIITILFAVHLALISYAQITEIREPIAGKIKEITVSSGAFKYVYEINKRTDKKHGKFVSYFNGLKQKEGTFFDGLEQGEWSFYGVDESLTFTANYYQGKPHGKWTFYFPGGELRSERYYKNGARDSVWTDYYRDSTVAFVRGYEYGRLEGQVTEYYPDGKLKNERHYHRGVLHGPLRMYFNNDSLYMELEYINDHRYKLNVMKDSYGNDLDAGDFENGQGQLNVYYRKSLEPGSGPAQLYSVTEYENGLAQGKAKYYYRNGTLWKEGRYAAGDAAGVWTYYTEEDGKEDFKRDYSEPGVRKTSKADIDDASRVDVYSIVEEMPEFPGGQAALFKFLQKNVRYPSVAKDHNIMGTVYATFVINEVGMVENVSILRGIGGGCDEEVLRIVELMPHWKPGFQDDMPVKVQYNLPVKFSLR